MILQEVPSHVQPGPASQKAFVVYGVQYVGAGVVDPVVEPVVVPVVEPVVVPVFEEFPMTHERPFHTHPRTAGQVAAAAYAEQVTIPGVVDVEELSTGVVVDGVVSGVTGSATAGLREDPPDEPNRQPDTNNNPVIVNAKIFKQRIGYIPLVTSETR